MKFNTSNIKRKFLDFFKKKKHKIVASSSIIPEKNDNTLLFTNAGMNQFKNFYLGKNKPPHKNLTTSQYCIRTGGKHNDLNNIGNSDYHHTLFEMLGNFSFGGYFKKKAIQYAWELLTNKEEFNIPPKNLKITYYHLDVETRDIWINFIKIPPKNLVAVYDIHNKKYDSENFWQMDEIGPCGPCTEIFFDQKEIIQKNKKKNLHKERYVEIWNLVFMQYNKQENGKIIDLPIPCVDTGMGLERITSILQNVTSNYKIDTYKNIINFLLKKINNNSSLRSLKIIADHLRTIICLIAENIQPSNEGRGYILRKIIRRAFNQCNFLNIPCDPFLYKFIKYFIPHMQEENIFFKIQQKINTITETVEQEEKKFSYILKKGIKILEKEINNSSKNFIDKEKLLYLYDTFGLPIDISKEICKQKNISININIKRKKNIKCQEKESYGKLLKKIKIFTPFIGYEKTEKHSKIIKIIYKNKFVEKIQKKNKAIIIIETTPFYSQSGGQIGDTGKIYTKNSIFIVQDTKKYNDTICHIGFVKNGEFFIQQKIFAKINKKKRNQIQSNHTSTHLLHATLKKILDINISQKGSYITPEYLRFDFSYLEKIDQKKIQDIEKFVNKKIQKNLKIETIYTEKSKISEFNAIALFYKKYKKNIRIIKINNISIELCGGTHHKRTGNIGIFKITSLKNIGYGIKRIEAITGNNAIKNFQKKFDIIQKIEKNLNIPEEKILERIKKNKIDIKNLTKEIKGLRSIENKIISNKLIKKKETYRNINLIFSKILKKNFKDLCDILSKTKIKKISSIIILFGINKNKIIFLIYVSKILKPMLKNDQIMKKILKKYKGKGGGKENISKGVLETEKINSKELNEIKKIIYSYIHKILKNLQNKT